MGEFRSVDDAVEAGRLALRRGAWQEARASFEAALAQGATPEALEGVSWAAWWLEDVPGCLSARAEAYRLYRRGGLVPAGGTDPRGAGAVP